MFWELKEAGLLLPVHASTGVISFFPIGLAIIINKPYY